MKQVKGYSIIQKQELNELNATGYLLRHDKTKAKVAVIENEDENKSIEDLKDAIDFSI